jgi:hypothetical protein
MDILSEIINAKGGAAVRQLGSQFGLGEQQTTAALSALVPVLAVGFQRNMQNQGGLGSLISALSAGNHRQYLDNPQSLGQHTTVKDGNGILGHILGSKDVSREVASRAASQTGLSSDVMKQMLPLAAALMMSAFSQKAQGGAPMAAPAASGSGLADMLTPLLDRNRDGSMIDDVAGMISRYMR